MISRTIAKLDHMACPCKKAPSLVLVKTHGGIRYRVEAHCCHIVTAMMRTELAATNEFQRILGALAMDAELAEVDVPQVTFQQTQQAHARH